MAANKSNFNRDPTRKRINHLYMAEHYAAQGLPVIIVREGIKRREEREVDFEIRCKKF